MKKWYILGIYIYIYIYLFILKNIIIIIIISISCILYFFAHCLEINENDLHKEKDGGIGM